MKRLVATFLLSSSLAACGSGISGTYSDASGSISYEFDGRNVVIANEARGQRTENQGTFVVDGQRIEITVPGNGNPKHTVTINEDGSLLTPFGLLTKE